MRASEHAPRDPSRVFERRHGLAEIVERGVGVDVERRRIHHPHREREIMIFSENASRHRYRFAEHQLGFIEALQLDKGIRVVVGRPERQWSCWQVALQ